MSFKLFVSYSDKDRNRIEPVLFLMRNMPENTNGLLDIFFYEDNRKPGNNATHEIVNEIRTSDAVLYFHSENSAYSQYVQNEIGGAVTAGKQVIVANLDNAENTGMTQGINYLNFYNPDVFNREMRKLMETVSLNIVEKQSQHKAPNILYQEEALPIEQVLTETALVAESPYSLEDWKMVLGIAGIIALAFICLRS